MKISKWVLYMLCSIYIALCLIAAYVIIVEAIYLAGLSDFKY